MSDCKLTGFVRDPKTGRYYRTGAGAPEFVQKLEEENKSDHLKKEEWSLSNYSKSIPSLPLAISLRENGLLSHNKYSSSAFRSKLKNADIISIYQMEDRNFHDINQLVTNSGNYYYVIGRCFTSRALYRGCNTIDRIHFSFHENADDHAYVNCATGFISSHCRSIQEVCSVGDRVLFVANSGCPRPNSRSTVAIVPIGSNDFDNSFYWSIKELVRCCDYDVSSNMIVVGTATSLVKITNLDSAKRCSTVKKDIFSIALKDQGRSVIYGNHNGTLFDMDFREKNSHHMLKMKSSVLRLMPLESGNEFFASGYEHQLCLIDLRMRRISRTFHNHVNRCYKIPFSYCETNKLLCSAGQDNNIRVWSLHQSTPLTTLNFENQNPKSHRFCFLSAKNRSMYLHSFYEQEITTYDLNL